MNKRKRNKVDNNENLNNEIKDINKNLIKDKNKLNEKFKINLNHINYNFVKCKHRRKILNYKLKSTRNKYKKIQKIAKKQERSLKGLPKEEPKTIETMKKCVDAIDFSNPEHIMKLENINKNDEFEGIISGKENPKILLTSSKEINKKFYD